MKNISIEEFADNCIDMMYKFENIFKFIPSKKIRSLNLTVGQVKVLKIIGTSERLLTISEIGKKLSAPMAKMTRVIDKLESNQLAERVRDENDRRVIRVRLSVNGTKLAEAHRNAHKNQIITILNNLSDKDRSRFINAVNTFTNIILKESNE